MYEDKSMNKSWAGPIPVGLSPFQRQNEETNKDKICFFQPLKVGKRKKEETKFASLLALRSTMEATALSSAATIVSSSSSPLSIFSPKKRTDSSSPRIVRLSKSNP